MNIRVGCMTVALVILSASIPVASAQQRLENAEMSQSPKASKAAPAADMDALMKQCADMRRHMKAGAPMTGDMRRLMSQCEEMDKTMTAPEQPYTPPAERRR